MTKSTKHKREFRKEKNKIKLKLTFKAEKNGKKKKGMLLPKGLNVTDTSFKSKKIIIPNHSHLSEDCGVPVNNKNQTYKELLSHMSHFSTTIQQDGINGMKELLMKYPEVLEINMGSLFGKLSESLSVRDATVRKCALNLLEYMIKTAPTNKIMPFFPLLNAQLMCCMNHIALDIQKDSHFLLDILITYVPELVSNVAMQILPNFLEQISCRDNSKDGKRVLTFNLNQKMTSLKWRQEVLLRVQHLLSLLLDKRQLNTQEFKHVIYSEGIECPLYIQRNFNVALCAKQSDIIFSEKFSPSRQFQDFTLHLFPLLVETWVEALTSEQLNKNQGGALIGFDTSCLLSILTNIMFTLWNIMGQREDNVELHKNFTKLYSEPLIRNFIQHLPFSTRMGITSQKKSSGECSCREQNLILCFLWVQLDTKYASKYCDVVFQYLEGLFKGVKLQTLTSLEMKLLKDTLLHSCHRKGFKNHVDSAIDAIVNFSKRVGPERKDRLMINKILIDIGENVDVKHLPSLNQWIETCPVLVRDITNFELLGSINRIMTRNETSLLTGRTVARELMTNMEKLEIDSQCWKAAFDFVYLAKKNTPVSGKVMGILRRHVQRLEDPIVKCYGVGLLKLIGAIS